MEIRHATPADRNALERLAGRDSAGVPGGDLLVAATDGHLLAALSLRTGQAIADPFEPTAAIVDALRAYATPMQRRRRAGRLSLRGAPQPG